MSPERITVRKDGMGGVIWIVSVNDKPRVTIWPNGEVTGDPLLASQIAPVIGATYALSDVQSFTEEEMLGFLITTIALTD